MDDFEVDGDKRYTSGDDPNKDVLQSAHDDIKPQFQLGNDSDAKPDASNPNRILGNAEQNASTSINNNTDSDDTKSDANTAESMGGNGFANNVTSGTSTRTKFSGSGAKGFLKKRAPLLALIALLGGGGAGIMSTQNLLPFALVTRALQEWNSQEIMSSRRYRVLLNKKLSASAMSRKHTNMFGDVKFSKKQQKFLKKQGIEVIEIESGGKKAKALLAEGPDGKKKIILGNGKGSGINKKFRDSVSADMASGKLKGAKGVDFGNNKAISFKNRS